MKVESLDELVTIMRCNGRTPNCIGKDCVVCIATLLYNYFDISLKDEYKKEMK